MASNDDFDWSNVLTGSKLLLTNTGGPLGFASAVVECVSADANGGYQAFDGALNGTQTISLKVEGLYSISWLLIATSDEDGLSGAAGFSAQVVNADGSTNGTTFTASIASSGSEPTSESGILNVGVIWA